MKAKATWQGGLSFSGSAGAGFHVPLSGGPSIDGEYDGFRPMELVAMGLAGCTAMDVISILLKKKQDVTSFDVNVHATQAREHPHVFTEVQIEYLVGGRDIDPTAVQRSIELSTSKYCPVHAMLKHSVNMEYSFKIVEMAG